MIQPLRPADERIWVRETDQPTVLKLEGMQVREVPTPGSETTSKRETGPGGWDGWPVDLVIFDSDEHAGEWEHVLAIIEFKQPTLEEGQSQLEIYLRQPVAMSSTCCV